MLFWLFAHSLGVLTLQDTGSSSAVSLVRLVPVLLELELFADPLLDLADAPVIVQAAEEVTPQLLWHDPEELAASI